MGVYPESFSSFLIASNVSENSSLLSDVVKRLEDDDEFPAELLPIELPNISAASTVDLLAVDNDINTLEQQKALFDEYSSLFEKDSFQLDHSVFQSNNTFFFFFLFFYI